MKQIIQQIVSQRLDQAIYDKDQAPGWAHEIAEEIKRGEFDLVVMGSPFPQKDGRISLNGLIEGVMKNAGNCSVLIVRSHYHKNTMKQNWSESLYTYIS